MTADGYTMFVRGKRVILHDCEDLTLVACNRVHVQSSYHVLVTSSREVGGSANVNRSEALDPLLADMLGLVGEDDLQSTLVAARDFIAASTTGDDVAAQDLLARIDDLRTRGAR